MWESLFSSEKLLLGVRHINKWAPAVFPSLLSGVLLILPPVPAFGDSSDLLETLREEHQAAVASIQTFYCEVSIAYDPVPSSGNESGKYWRSGNQVRCQGASKTTKSDVLVRGEHYKCLSKYPFLQGEQETAAVVGTTNVPIRCDAWSFGMLTFYGRDRFRVSLADLLSQPHKLHAIRTVEEGGRKLAYLDLIHDRARLEIWFDPQVNYLAQKMRLHTGKSESEKVSEQVVARFKEVVPGIFFPERVDSTTVQGGEKKASWHAAFSNIQINKPLPAGIFDLRFPSGIVVSDLVRGKMFKTDASGEPTLPAANRRGNELTLTQAPPFPIAQDGNQRPSVTTEEPRSWTRWLFPVALIFFALAGILWFMRHRRKPAGAPA